MVGKMKTGPCSITFRKLDVQQIVALVKEVGLDAIEWGGDVHVPPGDTAAAEAAKRITTESGLKTSSYGSYYNVLDAEGTPGDFGPVLDSALALETDTVRIWAGARPSDYADAAYRAKLIDKLNADLELAAKHKIRLAFEFHMNTLTDSNAAALALLDEVGHSNLYTYWQPMYWVADTDYRFQGLEKLAPRVLNLHVFHWLFHPVKGGWGDNIDRRPLAEGEDEWKKYFSVNLPEGDHYALMEFVRNDDPEQFKQDAAVLRRVLS